MIKKNFCLSLILILFIVGIAGTASICLAQEGELELPRPLGDRDISAIIGDIIKYVLGAVGMLTLVMLIYGGIMWMTSGGNAQQVKKGKDTIFWAILSISPTRPRSTINSRQSWSSRCICIDEIVCNTCECCRVVSLSISLVA